MISGCEGGGGFPERWRLAGAPFPVFGDHVAMMPALFISHGAPSIALEHDDFTRATAAYGATLAGARAIAIVSAHWQTRGLRVNAVERPETIYDFGGFSEALYGIRYEAPGESAEVVDCLGTFDCVHAEKMDLPLDLPFA